MTGGEAERRNGGARRRLLLGALFPGLLLAQETSLRPSLSLTPAGAIGWGMCDGAGRSPECLARLDRLTADCPDSVAWTVAFGGPGTGNRVEWRRCLAVALPGQDTTADGMGPGERHVLLVREGPSGADPVVLAWDNIEEPGLTFLDRVGPVNPDGDGAAELAIWAGLYGTGSGRAWCVLGARPDGFFCWPWPDPGALAAPRLGPDGQIRKGWIATDDPLVALRPGGTLTLSTGIYRPGDGNCCPSGGEIRLSFRPGERRMVYAP